MYRLQEEIIIPVEEVDHLLSLTKQLDIAPGPGGSRISDYAQTRTLYEPLIKKYFPDRQINQIMVVALYPSAQIVGHVDAPIKGTRYHIPLQSNGGCWCLSGEIWEGLCVGWIYEMSPSEFHGAVNWGHTLRLHLAVDVE